MKIRCDRCRKEVEKDQAVERQLEDETLYFCSEECAELKERLEPSDEPDREEKAAPPPMGSAETDAVQ